MLATLDGGNGRHLRIAPLDDVAVGSLVASMTGAAPGASLTSRLGGAAGNPLFVIELLRALDHDDALRVDAGVVETDAQALPATVRDAVVRRLSSMAPPTVEVLRLASLLGSEFLLADLAAVAGQSVVSVAAHLHEAVDAAVLSGEGETLSFRHDLIREAIYDDIAPAIRRDLHAAAGRALSAVGAPTLPVARQFALAAQSLCLVSLAEGRHDDALDHAISARDILDAQWVAPMGFLIPHLWVGNAHAYLDQFDEFLAAYGVARRRAERRGETTFLLLAHAGTACGHFFACRWDDAVSEIEAGLALAAETGAEAMTLLSHALAARIAVSQGDLPAADEHLAAGNQLLAAGGHLFGVDLLAWAQAGVFEARGEPAAARAVLETLWDQTMTIRYLLQYRNYAPDLVRLATAQGGLDRALAVTAEIEQAAGRSTSVSATAVALRTRGLVDNDPDALVEAVARYRRTPRRLEFAGTCEDAARALVDHGRRDAAAELLDEAGGVYIEAGADQDLARIDSLLRACGSPRRRHGRARATHGWDALSPKEREVVGFVVEGLRNPEIGARLYISRRTVETHLSHVFRKLDVAYRAQLAAAAAGRRQGPTV